MMRSRLRNPTSKSSTAVLWPRNARPAAKLALLVVLPTPPLPDVTTMILAIGCASFPKLPSETAIGIAGPVLPAARIRSELQFLKHQFFALQAYLCRLAAQFSRHRRVARAVQAGNRNQLRLHARGEDPRFGIAQCTGDRASPQRRIDVNVAVRNHFVTEAHHRHHYQIASLGVNALARAQRLVDKHRQAAALGPA